MQQYTVESLENQRSKTRVVGDASLRSISVEKKARILIVDNDPAMLKILERYLEVVGVNIISVECPAQALRMIEAEEYALMIVDVRMPTMSGFEFAEKVRSARRGTATPIIFISSAYSPGLMKEGYRFGAVDFLLKPVEPEVLRSKAKIFVKLFEEKMRAELTARALSQVNVSLRETKAALEKSYSDAKSNENYFRTIFECTDDAVLLLSPDKIIANSNVAASDLLEYSQKELESKPIQELFPYEYRELFREPEDENPIWKSNVACLSKTGVLLSTDVSVSRLPAEGRRQRLLIVRDRTEQDRLREQAVYLHEELKSQSGFEYIIGKAKPIHEILEKVKLVAPTDATVLITGESGSGKELVARAIHESSPRKDGSFVRVNCGSIPRELFESEFFGHVKGAFTGAIKDRLGRFDLAHGGTLFLDEVGEIPASCQAKLLRVLQDHEFERVGDGKTRKTDARIIAATNRDLKQEVENKHFRKDLFYRLNTFPIEVPPLRERREDIPMLAQHFANLACDRMGRSRISLTESQMSHLKAYAWPGNVRELQQVIDRAVILGSKSSLLIEGLTDSMDKAGEIQKGEVRVKPMVENFEELHEVEHDMVLKALEKCHWRIYGEDGAAKLLGIKPTTLNSRLSRMGIKRPHP